jgi:hypothetical protein
MMSMHVLQLATFDRRDTYKRVHVDIIQEYIMSVTMTATRVSLMRRIRSDALVSCSDHVFPFFFICSF